jgi:hypothetical protein
MPKACIICGQRAGSREHTFPAGLGGRRTNKGIYCGPHNQGFSHLANIITQQLKSINALLAVRPDHKNSAEPIYYTSPEGERLVIFNGLVKRATPDVADSDRSLHVQLQLGGPDGLRSIAYIALTFFAHHFQNCARHSGLDAVKAFLLGNGNNDFVWWETARAVDTLPPNPFPFGHTIVVMTSATTQEATAFVSLFQSFYFGITLGRLSGLTDKSVVVCIDPQADKAPSDIREDKRDIVLLPLVKPDPMHAHLERNIRERTSQRSLQELLNKIQRWKFDKDMASVLLRLNAARGLPADRLVGQITTIVEEQASRVYQLMKYVAAEFITAQKDNPTVQPVMRHLKAMIERDAAVPSALTPTAEDCAIRCMLALVNDLAKRLIQRDITLDDLWEVFSSGHGAGIVGGIMFAAFRV